MQQSGLLNTIHSVQRSVIQHDQDGFVGQRVDADVLNPGPCQMQTRGCTIGSSSSPTCAVVPKCSCMSCACLGTQDSITCTQSKEIEGRAAVFTFCRFPCCIKRLEQLAWSYKALERSPEYFQKELRSKLVSHERTHYGQPGAYPCLEAGCQATAKKFHDLRRHYRGRHCSNVVKYPCKELGCKYSGDNGFVRKDKLKDHQRNVHGGRTYPAKSFQPLKAKTEEVQEVESRAEGIAQPRKRVRKE